MEESKRNKKEGPSKSRNSRTGSNFSMIIFPTKKPHWRVLWLLKYIIGRNE
jgi:hypothetical protein